MAVWNGGSDHRGNVAHVTFERVRVALPKFETVRTKSQETDQKDRAGIRRDIFAPPTGQIPEQTTGETSVWSPKGIL